MSLVPKSIISAWFRKDSWVYANFAFLFVNPLWQNKIPNGFSLCPFFWLSLFSLFIVRPIVYSSLAFMFFVKQLRLGKLITFFDRMVCKVLPLNQAIGTSVPTILAVSWSLMALMSLFAIGHGLHSLFTQYKAADCLPALFLPLICTAVFLICSIYRINNRYGQCKVEIYTRIVTLFSVIVAFILMPSAALQCFVLFPCGIVVVTCHVLKEMFMALGTVFAWGFSHIFVFLKQFAMLAIGCVIAAVVLGIIGWILSRFDFLNNAKAPSTEKPEDKPKKPKEPSIGVSRAEQRDRLQRMGYQMYRDTDLRLSSAEWTNLMRNMPEAWVYARMDDGKWCDAWYNSNQGITDVYAMAKLKGLEKLKQRDARDRKCQKATEAFQKAWHVLIGQPFTYLVAKPVKHIVIFGAVIWELIKAKKQGACPYMKFEDVAK